MFLENWICSYIFQSSFDRNKKVDFIEQFNEKLLVKQENENLQILDVCIYFVFQKLLMC